MSLNRALERATRPRESPARLRSLVVGALISGHDPRCPTPIAGYDAQAAEVVMGIVAILTLGYGPLG